MKQKGLFLRARCVVFLTPNYGTDYRDGVDSVRIVGGQTVTLGAPENTLLK